MFRKLGWIFCGLQSAYYLRHFILISPLPLVMLANASLTDLEAHTLNWNLVPCFAFVAIS